MSIDTFGDIYAKQAEISRLQLEEKVSGSTPELEARIAQDQQDIAHDWAVINVEKNATQLLETQLEVAKEGKKRAKEHLEQMEEGQAPVVQLQPSVQTTSQGDQDLVQQVQQGATTSLLA